MLTVRHSLLLIFVFAGIACKDSGTSYEGSFLGVFKYSAYDTIGTLVMSGNFHLFRHDSQLSGPWELSDGSSGELKGTIRENTVGFDLFPNFMDNNLLLEGTLAGSVIAGTWKRIGFAGEMARGLFTAVRQ